MRWLLLALLASISWAAELQVEIRSNEVWLVSDGSDKQLTNDGRSKAEAQISPGGVKIAYYEICFAGENCLPSVVILDMEGRRLKAFHVISEAGGPPAEPCGTVLRIMWLTETRLAAECHLNPSLSEYVETDLDSGKTVKDLLGLWFTPSPDRRYVAHGGWIPHFAPVINKSDYLQIDGATVYPLPRGARPNKDPLDIVRRRGSTWIGVHDFVGKFSWSPDSSRVAFVDCLFDWAENGVYLNEATPDGNEMNRRCSVVVVTRTGKSVSFPIAGTRLINARDVNLSWDSPSVLSARVAGTSRKFRLEP